MQKKVNRKWPWSLNNFIGTGCQSSEVCGFVTVEDECSAHTVTQCMRKSPQLPFALLGPWGEASLRFAGVVEGGESTSHSVLLAVELIVRLTRERGRPVNQCGIWSIRMSGSLKPCSSLQSWNTDCKQWAFLVGPNHASTSRSSALLLSLAPCASGASHREQYSGCGPGNYGWGEKFRAVAKPLNHKTGLLMCHAWGGKAQKQAGEAHINGFSTCQVWCPLAQKDLNTVHQ